MRAVASTRSTGASSGSSSGGGDARVDAAEGRPGPRRAPASSGGTVDVDAAPGRRQLERRAGGVERGLAEVEVDAAAADAHRAAPQRRRPARSLDAADVGRDRELVGRLVADGPAAGEHLSERPAAPTSTATDLATASLASRSSRPPLRRHAPDDSSLESARWVSALQGGRLAARAIAAAGVDVALHALRRPRDADLRGLPPRGRPRRRRPRTSSPPRTRPRRGAASGARAASRSSPRARASPGPSRPSRTASRRRRRSSCSAARARSRRPSGARCRSSTSSR